MSADRPLVVLAGPIHADGHANLETGARVVVCTDETEAGLVKIAAEAQGILFRTKPRCTESLMAACPKLKVVGRHGVGLDTVDIPAATRLGVAVVHAPGSNSQAVAEHALMLMLVCVKKTLASRQADAGGRLGRQAHLGQHRAHRAGRQDARHRRRRQRRAPGGEVRRRHRHEGARLRQVRAGRRAPPPRRRAGREPGAAAAAGRRAHLPHAAHARDEAHDQRQDARPHEAGRRSTSTRRAAACRRSTRCSRRSRAGSSAPPASTCSRRSRARPTTRFSISRTSCCSTHVAGVTREATARASRAGDQRDAAGAARREARRARQPGGRAAPRTQVECRHAHRHAPSA